MVFLWYSFFLMIFLWTWFCAVNWVFSREFKEKTLRVFAVSEHGIDKDSRVSWKRKINYEKKLHSWHFKWIGPRDFNTHDFFYTFFFLIFCSCLTIKKSQIKKMIEEKENEMKFFDSRILRKKRIFLTERFNNFSWSKITKENSLKFVEFIGSDDTTEAIVGWCWSKDCRQWGWNKYGFEEGDNSESIDGEGCTERPTAGC